MEPYERGRRRRRLNPRFVILCLSAVLLALTVAVITVLIGKSRGLPGEGGPGEELPVPDYVENGYGIYDGIEERTGYMIVTGVSNYKEAMNRIDACYSDIVFMPEHLKEWPNRVKFSHKIHTS